jgi:hypothetical protein
MHLNSKPSTLATKHIRVALIYLIPLSLINAVSAEPARMPAQALESLPCAKYLGAIGTTGFPVINDALTSYVADRGNSLGSAANIVDYVATECRLREALAVGKAIKNLLVQEKENRLPAIPIGGATDDPDVHKTWKAFDRWIHHQGPRPEIVAPSATSVSTTPSTSFTPIEEKAAIDQTMRGKYRAIDALVILVEANSYKCDSISAVSTWVFSRGFTLYCNRFGYKYEIADKGGHWTVTVK